MIEQTREIVHKFNTVYGPALVEPEILLPENFQFAGQAVKDIPMPGDVILVCITRDAEFIIPHGNTTLLPWDRILCLTQDDTLHLLMDAWGLSDK